MNLPRETLAVLRRGATSTRLRGRHRAGFETPRYIPEAGSKPAKHDVGSHQPRVQGRSWSLLSQPGAFSAGRREDGVPQ